MRTVKRSYIFPAQLNLGKEAFIIDTISGSGEIMSTDTREFTREAVVEFIRELLEDLSRVRAGETTVNELRIVNQLISCHMQGRTCTVTSLHRKTRIPMPTVSRIIAQLQSRGWVCDEPDPEDGRSRIIRMRPEALETMTIDFDAMAEWLNAFGERGLPRKSELNCCS